MIHLFHEESDYKILQFLRANRNRTVLLAAPAFLAQLHYAERNQKAKGMRFDIPIAPLNNDLTLYEPIAERVYVVADPEGEEKRLNQLKALFPSVRFLGLGRDLFPALVARSGKSIFEEIPQNTLPSTATLVIATPRSGSSLLGDVLTDIGAGHVIEHLRGEAVDVFNSDYNFNFKDSFRNFINFSSTGDFFGTKLISHFLSDFLISRSSVSDIVDVCAGMKMRVIFLDRRDKVAQAVSGYVASKRGIWHITSEADAQKIKAQALPSLDFSSALSRYFLYQSQKGFIDSLSPFFGDTLHLTYEDDLLDVDLSRLAKILADFIGIDNPNLELSRALMRKKISDADSFGMISEFRERFRALFGREP